MNYNSYYDVGINELAFLEACMQVIDKTPTFNGFVVQEQQVCEKLLKHLVQVYVSDPDVEKVLKSHKLYTLVTRIEKALGIPLELDSAVLRFLSDFYFDGRYPGTDFVEATREDAERGYAVTKSVKEKVEWVLKNCRPETRQMSFFD